MLKLAALAVIVRPIKYTQQAPARINKTKINSESLGIYSCLMSVTPNETVAASEQINIIRDETSSPKNRLR